MADKKLSVDERIDEIIEYWDFSPLQDEDERIKRLKTEFLSLIKEVYEEVTPNRCTATRGNTQNPNNPMYSTKYAKGWNDCINILNENIRRLDNTVRFIEKIEIKKEQEQHFDTAPKPSVEYIKVF